MKKALLRNNNSITQAKNRKYIKGGDSARYEFEKDKEHNEENKIKIKIKKSVAASS